MLRSAPVPVVKVTIPPAIAPLVPEALENVATPVGLLITAFWTPLARSIAVSEVAARSPVGVPVVPR